MQFETLETRRLLSSVAVATFSDGTTATVDNGQLLISNPTGGSVQIVAIEKGFGGDLPNGTVQIVDLNSFEFATAEGVTSGISVTGSSVDDQIGLRTFSVASQVNGGSGNDSISIEDHSAAGGDVVDAGSGDDTIELVASHNASLNGSAGADTFNINTGAIGNVVDFDYNDAIVTLNGAGGDDTINIFGGTASVQGAGGTDTLNLFGGATASYKNVEFVNVA